MNDDNAIVQLEDVAKHYAKGAELIGALDGLNLRIEGPSMNAIVGPSGSGKSTLLHIIGAMDRPTRGRVLVAGQELGELAEKALTAFRRRTVGFVFQTFNLIPNLTALENVMLPMEFNKVPRDEQATRAKHLLEAVGLAARLSHRPKELSGGEQQRVAIARALANDPPLVLADEPTGNLDSKNGRMIYNLLQEVASERTVLVVSHDEMLAETADRVFHISDGRIEDVLPGRRHSPPQPRRSAYNEMFGDALNRLPEH